MESQSVTVAAQKNGPLPPKLDRNALNSFGIALFCRFCRQFLSERSTRPRHARATMVASLVDFWRSSHLHVDQSASLELIKLSELNPYQR